MFPDSSFLRRLPASSAISLSLSASCGGTDGSARASCDCSSRPATVSRRLLSSDEAAARSAAACSSWRRLRAARISRTRRPHPEMAKLISSGMARPECLKMASASPVAASSKELSSTTMEWPRRRSAARASLRLETVSTARLNCLATTAAQFSAPAIPVTRRTLSSGAGRVEFPEVLADGRDSVDLISRMGEVLDGYRPALQIGGRFAANAVFLQLAVESGFADAEQAGGGELVSVELPQRV